MKNKDSKVYTILGKSGYGKSYFIKHEILPSLEHYIIFDTQKEYTDFGYVVTKLDDLKFLECKKIVIQFKEHEQYFSFLWYVNKYMENINLVIDELGLFVTSRNDDQNLNEIILTHRHKNINLWLATQSPRFISTIILTQSKTVYCFRLKKAEISNLDKKLSLNDDEKELIENLDVGDKIIIEN